MLDWIFFFLKIFLGLAFCYFMIFFLGWLDVKSKLAKYEAQGISVAPSSYDFIVGTLPAFNKWTEATMSETATVKHAYPFLLDLWYGKGGVFKPEE